MERLQISGADLTNFKQADTICLDPQKEVEINNVFSINPKGEIPARFLSGFLSSFGVAEIIQQKSDGDINPRVRIFIPSSIGSFVNAIPEEIVNRQINQGTELIINLAEKHFPTIDFFLEKDEPVTDDTLTILSELSQLAQVTEESLCFSNSISESGQRHGGTNGKDNSQLYVPHHSFGWRDMFHAAIFNSRPPFTVINTLPPSEKRFNEMRYGLRNKLQETGNNELICSGERFDLTMNMCGVPHYLLITDPNNNCREPSMSDVSSISVAEVLDDLQKRFKAETNSGVKENLRRARQDFGKLVTVLSHGRNDAQNASLQELLINNTI